MEFIPTEIPEVVLIKPKVFGDERGFFMETWQRREFASAGIDFDFVQDNYSRSQVNILRGLHYQIRNPQGKLVRVSRGKVFDVAVDLRRSSPSFGKWVGEYLDSESHHMLWIPPGFAHGFYVVEGPADFQYKCTNYYTPPYERCIRWDDSKVKIRWPLVNGVSPLVSSKDASGLELSLAETFL